ncbi:MAG: spore maturation protein [Clostridium sp.]|nr:spore maturation protein [Clostridium sp.]
MDYIIKSIIPIILGAIICYGMFKKVKVYECFVEGAKEGITICIKIFPYLLAMLVAIAIFRKSRGMDYFIMLVKPIASVIGLPPELVPLAVVKPLSGSGSMGLFAEILKKYGTDTYIGLVASIMMGSTETIFYTITVYFGAIKIKKIRHTLIAAIFADITSIVIAVIVAKFI